MINLAFHTPKVYLSVESVLLSGYMLFKALALYSLHLLSGQD